MTKNKVSPVYAIVIIVVVMGVLVGLFVLPSILTYHCKQGILKGDACYTEPEYINKSFCVDIAPGDVVPIITIIYPNHSSYGHDTFSRCVIEDLVFSNITFVSNASHWVHRPEYRTDLSVIINSGMTSERVCANMTYTAQWKRMIWHDTDTKSSSIFSICKDEIIAAGGEWR